VDAILDRLGELPEVGPSSLVAHGRYHPAGFVQHEVAFGRVELHDHTVDPHLVGGGVDPRPQFEHDLPVHLNATARDERLAGTSGGHSGMRKRLLQPGKVVVAAHSSKPSLGSSSSGAMGGSSSRLEMPR